MFPLLARGRDRLETCLPFHIVLSLGYFLVPLLARGRDRLETFAQSRADQLIESPLLARGRDRLETIIMLMPPFDNCIPYSLGDAIDWKLNLRGL